MVYNRRWERIGCEGNDTGITVIKKNKKPGIFFRVLTIVRNALSIHAGEKLFVALGAAHTFEQFIHGFFCVHIAEEYPQQIHAL